VISTLGLQLASTKVHGKQAPIKMIRMQLNDLADESLAETPEGKLIIGILVNAVDSADFESYCFSRAEESPDGIFKSTAGNRPKVTVKKTDNRVEASFFISEAFVYLCGLVDINPMRALGIIASTRPWLREILQRGVKGGVFSYSDKFHAEEADGRYVGFNMDWERKVWDDPIPDDDLSTVH